VRLDLPSAPSACRKVQNGTKVSRGRRWRAVLPGKRGSQTFDSKADAVAWLQTNAKRSTASAMTVSDWLDIWHADISRRVSTGTAIQYEIHCRLHIRPGIGHVRLASLTPADVRVLLAGLSPATASKVATTLRTALQAAVVARAASENVAATVGKPRVSKRPTEVWNADNVSVSGRPCGGLRSTPGVGRESCWRCVGWTSWETPCAFDDRSTSVVGNGTRRK